jgi:hypothetical protein
VIIKNYDLEVAKAEARELVKEFVNKWLVMSN